MHFGRARPWHVGRLGIRVGGGSFCRGAGALGQGLSGLSAGALAHPPPKRLISGCNADVCDVCEAVVARSIAEWGRGVTTWASVDSAHARKGWSVFVEMPVGLDSQ